MRKIFDQYFEWFLAEGSEVIRFLLFIVFMILVAVIGYLLEGFEFSLVGFLLVPLVFLGGVLMHGAHYLQDIYEIGAFSKVFDYLLGVVFGIVSPSLKISNGKKEIKDNEINTLDRIGGPGILKIEPGNVVILETLLAPSRIIGAGEHYIKRGEIIKDIVVLEEYSGKIENIELLTRDGIEVKVVDVEYRFCIYQMSRDDSLRTFQNPYPFSRKSVYDLVYNRNVSKDGITGAWTDSVLGVVKGIISEHITNHDLDSLISPGGSDSHPMFELRKKFDTPQSLEKIKAAGAKLLWINIGNFVVVSDVVEKQRMDVWLAKQSGMAKIMRAQGDAERIGSHERGRAESQAVLLRSIAQALQEIDSGGKHDKATTAKNLWNIVMARTAQILESMSSTHDTKHERES
ncbi:MAG: hypothetical protein U0V02_05895 [Anaerolineales bacterium]